jgi:hypothetical protein
MSSPLEPRSLVGRATLYYDLTPLIPPQALH